MKLHKSYQLIHWYYEILSLIFFIVNAAKKARILLPIFHEMIDDELLKADGRCRQRARGVPGNAYSPFADGKAHGQEHHAQMLRTWNVRQQAHAQMCGDQ